MRLTISNTPDSGQSAKIVYRDVASGSDTQTFDLTPGQDLVVELTAASHVVLIPDVVADGADPVQEPLVPAAAVAPADAQAAAGAPSSVAVISTDPDHTGDESGQSAVLITQDPDNGEILATPIAGDIDPSVHTVTINGDGEPSIATSDDSVPAPVLGDTALAATGTPAPSDPSHVDNPTSTVISVTAEPGAEGRDDPEPQPEPVQEAADDASKDAGGTDANQAGDEDAKAPPTAVVATTDPLAGTPLDQPLVMTAHPDTGDVLATPIISGDPADITTVTVAADGTPTANVDDGSTPIVLGDTAPAATGTPSLVDVAAQPGATDVSQGVPTHEDIATVIQGCIDNNATLTAQGYISIDDLNKALVDNGFAPTTETNANAAHDAVLGAPTT